MAAGKPNPFLIPAGVVNKIKEVIRHAFEKQPDRDPADPYYVTGTLKIDLATGKIMDMYLITDWIKTDTGYDPKFGLIWVKRPDGEMEMFGRIPYPDQTASDVSDVHTTES